MTTIRSQETVELYCDLEAIPLENRQTHQAITQRLVTRAYLEIKELADGYAFKFPAEEYEAITRYIANERLCCPFFTFELKIEANQSPIWLHLRGSEQIKTFLRSELQVSGK
jgi:hypothetical protein